MPFQYEFESTNDDGGTRGLDMQTTTDVRTAQGLLRLREKLAEQVPKRTVNETMLLATWNIRDFDSAKYDYRSDEAIYYIAEIISHFDLVAIQEVNADLEALHRLLDVLGSWWKVVFTDVTAGPQGNSERGAFVYDSRKIKFGGLAGEIVVPANKRADKSLEPQRQLSRTPFICGFESGYMRLMLCTVHIYYGQSKAEDPTRLAEIELLSNFLANRVKEEHAWSRNLVLVGDFNIFSPEDRTFAAIVDSGFYIPPQFAEMTTNAAGGKHFDQMAFISEAYENPIVQERLETCKAGVFNFFEHVYREEDEKGYAREMPRAYRTSSKGVRRDARQKLNYYKQWRTHQMSDHFPMWMELQIDFGDAYLRSVAEGTNQ